MRSVTLLVTVVALLAVAALKAEDTATAVFTEQQAAEGRAAYAKHCASCHLPDLSGNAEIPPLAGATFKDTWRNRTTKDLRDYMSAAMPYGAPSLEPDTYTVITAYVLQANGAVAGEEKLAASTAVPINAVVEKRSDGGK
jgi:mono/diheme cytochrome c family protein